MYKIDFGILPASYRLLLIRACQDVRALSASVHGVAFLSRDGHCWSDRHTKNHHPLSHDILVGKFFEEVSKVPPGQRRVYFHCIGLYGERVRFDYGVELLEMLDMRDEWKLPLYVMNKNGEVFYISPNDECPTKLLSGLLL